ncbi:LysR family transcriptional regulator [Streptomyces sp. NPDC057806]|uniref:LysR family transcriptional regulator n=1 Tax=Streptomyces sp. NPDC057806 TaxID=3346255 RepID=UPI0036C876B1
MIRSIQLRFFPDSGRAAYMLDVRRLRLLAAFAVHGTVAATADALHLTGPAVSQQLAALEKQAGVELLVKRGRTLHLTDAGRRLVDHAHVVLANLAAAESDLQGLRRGERGTVRIAAFPSAARSLVADVWPPAGAAPVGGFPALHLVEHEPTAAENALRKHQVDLAITHAYSLLPRPLPPGCEQQHLLEEPVYLVLHPDDAADYGLSAGSVADLGRFADSPWLVPAPGTSCHEMVQRACGAAGFVPRAVAVASDFTVLTALAARRAGVTLVPRLALPSASPGLSIHPLTSRVRRSLQVLYRAGTGQRPEIADVLRSLRETASQREGRTAVPD